MGVRVVLFCRAVDSHGAILHYGSKKLEEACGEVLQHTSSPSIRVISTVIKSTANKKAEEGETSVTRHSNAHGIARGAAYYSRDRRDGKDGEDK